VELSSAGFNDVMSKVSDTLARLLPKHILGPGLISLVIKLAGAVLAYGMVVAFARLLSTDEYGRFAFGLNLAIIAAAIGGFGFSTGIMRYWPKYVVAKDGAGARGVVKLGYIACVLGGFAMISAALVVAGLSHAFSVVEFLAIGLLGLVISLGDYSTNLLRAQGSTIVSMLPRDVLWRILSVIAAALVVWFGFVVSGPTALVICAVVLAALTLWQIMNVRTHMANELVGADNRNDWRDLRPSLLPLWASSVVFAMIQQFDVVIVGSLLGNADAGAYFAAQKTAMLLSLVLIAAGLVAAPTMAALYHSGKRLELQSLCRNLAAVIAAVTIVGFIMLIFVGRQLLSFFDPHFVSAYPILLIVAVGTMVDAVAGPNAYLMQMTSYERPYLRIMAVCYVLVLIAQFILVPLYGSIGAAIASTGGVVLWNVWAIILLRREAGLDPSLLSLFLPPQKSKIQ
jgi:O-antigen/teichoic acid export membrane protein